MEGGLHKCYIYGYAFVICLGSIAFGNLSAVICQLGADVAKFNIVSTTRFRGNEFSSTTSVCYGGAIIGCIIAGFMVYIVYSMYSYITEGVKC